jgi:hypothetical protein
MTFSITLSGAVKLWAVFFIAMPGVILNVVILSIIMLGVVVLLQTNVH